MIVDINKSVLGPFYMEAELSHSQQYIGSITLEGKINSRDCVITAVVNNNVLVMDKEYNIQKGYRPYRIMKDGIQIGTISQKTSKEGTLLRKYDYTCLCINNMVFNMYLINLGKKGSEMLIYLEEKYIEKNGRNFKLAEKQVAEISINEKSNLIYTDAKYLLPSVISYAYTYLVKSYTPGVNNPKENNNSKTTNKLLLKKYDPDFKKNYIDDS